jgi:subtilase family serine protease
MSRAGALRRERARRLAVLPAAVALALVPVAAAGAVTDMTAADGTPPTPTSAVPLFVPRWSVLQAQGGSASADLGPAAASAPVSARVYLAGRDPGGLAAYATAVSDPRSRSFHHYLTAAQVQARFGPTGAQVAAVRSWLATAGLSVTGVTAHYVAVSGTAAQAQDAFGAVWHSYQYGSTAQQSPPPDAQLSAPASTALAVAAIAPVQAVTDSTPTGAAGSPDTAVAPPRAASTTAPPPCSEYYGQDLATSLPPAYGHTVPYWGCGYTAQQLRSAYGVPAGLTGRGVTVAVVMNGYSPTAASDVATFAASQGHPLRPGQFTQVLLPSVADCPGPEGEEVPDAETVHGMAPDANLVYVGAGCTDAAVTALDGLTAVTDQHLASIVSDSWGIDPVSAGAIAAFEQIFQQGAAEGIGFYFSSGDNGDGSGVSADHQPAVGYPASDPWVTAVGGTSLAIGAHGSYEWEIGWGSYATGLTSDGTSWSDPPGTFGLGSGGGTSTVFRQPYYQRSTVPAALSHRYGGTAMRVIPDISADADMTTGILTGSTQSLEPGQPPQYAQVAFGGTSASAPLIAGLQADAQQAAGDVPIGFANPVIYQRCGRPAARGHAQPACHDITGHPRNLTGTQATAIPAGVQLNTGSVGGTGLMPPLLNTLGTDQGLTTGPGYDDVTGVGTPAAGYFTSYRP